MQQSELEYVEHIKEAPIKCMVVSVENSSPHWHYEYEVFFVLHGRVTANTENGSYRLEGGDLLLFNTREIHSINPTEPGNLCLFMQFSPGVLLEVYDTTLLFDLNTRSAASAPEFAAELRIILAELGLLLYEKPAGYQFAIKGALYRFISALLRSAPYKINKDEENKNDEQLKEFDIIQKYVKNHFKDDFTVDQLCRAIGMSRAKVFRCMRMSGSPSIKDLTNYFRLEYARNLLKNTSFTISYIADECGFNSQASFYRLFKKAAGLPPNQYRESPEKRIVPSGVRGYADYPLYTAIKLLREYAG
jgi:AraC-like DNA-binding protein